MDISKITVKNFRGLHDLTTPISNFSCLIGENNAGKSSFLLALKLFIEGKKLSQGEFYDSKQDVWISIEFTSVTEDDLNLLVAEHRARIKELIYDDKLTFIRRFKVDTKPELKCMKRVPIYEQFNEDFIDEKLKGKKKKEIQEFLSEYYSEIDDDTIKEVSTQADARTAIKTIIKNLPEEAFKSEESVLPTGFDNSIKPLLPEPIYIAAVKELGEDIKTKESTPFGKLLGILLNMIGGELKDAETTFNHLNKSLNRVLGDDGVIQDNRLKHVQEIEKTVQGFVQETFGSAKLELRIPPPEIKTVLSSAEIWADDGVMTPVEMKGDGFKRAITFSVLRSYVELSKKPEWQPNSSTAPLNENSSENAAITKQKYLFLFEEPELYLHPNAQRILFDALAQIAKNHQVVISTHSPFFFSHDVTGTFIKIIKSPEDEFRPKPYGRAIPVNVQNMSEKDKFQLISFETNNSAFFAEKIVLVEGDSDYIVYPHMARLLKPEWVIGRSKIEIVKIGGKKSIKRFKEFFERFQTRVFVIADLDIIKNDPSDMGLLIDPTLRNNLFQTIDTLIEANKPSEELPWKKISRYLEQGDQRVRWKKADDLYKKYLEDPTCVHDLHQAINDFFEFEKMAPRMEVLRESRDENLVRLKRLYITALREQGIFCLDKGEIENYYPDSISGIGKVEKAQEYCRSVRKREDVLAKCDLIEGQAELEFVFEQIFRQ